jgi:citrate lyase beta subunit
MNAWSSLRQPVHTVYGGAHLFRADAARKLGELALGSLAHYARDAEEFAAAFGIAAEVAAAIRSRIEEKLRTEPVEDYRIDFEDGYGSRSDVEEDGHASAAAEEVARGLAAGTLSPGLGIRIKSLSGPTRERAVKTLNRFMTTLVRASGGAVPDGFVVTLPKVRGPQEVNMLSEMLAAVEGELGILEGFLRLEIMVETREALVAHDGRLALGRLVDAGHGRCVAAHFGTYDFTASLGVAGSHQRMDHPYCDLARGLMKLSLAGTGILLSDGATNVMPVPVHRPSRDGSPLGEAEERENRELVHRAWRAHYGNVRRALHLGFYQGWDLHPAQLPARYAAVYAFFHEEKVEGAARLRAFVDRATRATLSGQLFDDAATGQGLLELFLRAIASGAMSEEEASAITSLTIEELRGRSFLAIASSRRR